MVMGEEYPSLSSQAKREHNTFFCFCIIHAFMALKDVHPQWERPSALSSPPKYVNLFLKHPYRQAQKQYLITYLGIPWPNQVDTYN